MNGIIENLNKKIEAMGLQLLDERRDKEYDFTYFMAVQTEKAIFLIYTTRSYIKINPNRFLRVFRVTEHLPFNTVDALPGGDFATPYKIAIKESGRCEVYYDRCFSLEELVQLLNS